LVAELAAIDIYVGERGIGMARTSIRKALTQTNKRDRRLVRIVAFGTKPRAMLFREKDALLTRGSTNTIGMSPYRPLRMACSPRDLGHAETIGEHALDLA
jgi:hypothetical protein